jgi:hypothetical protein
MRVMGVRHFKHSTTDGDLVVVTKGANEGDSIIVGNLQKLGPGTAVHAGPDEQPIRACRPALRDTGVKEGGARLPNMRRMIGGRAPNRARSTGVSRSMRRMAPHIFASEEGYACGYAGFSHRIY